MNEDKKKNFRNSLKFQGEELVKLANSKPKYSDKELRRIYQGRAIQDDEILNLEQLYKQRENEERMAKYDKMIEEAEREEYAEKQIRQQEYKKKIKKASKGKKVFKTLVALGGSALVALGAYNIGKKNLDKPITIQQVNDNKEIMLPRIGNSEQTISGIIEMNDELQDTSNFTNEDANSTLIKLNNTWNDVLEEKTENALGREADIRFGSKFEDGGTVEYMIVDGQIYFEDSALNSIVNENTIPKSIANAIEEFQENQRFMTRCTSENVSLSEKIKQCKDSNNSLMEFATIQITYNPNRDIFEDHTIRQSELIEILKNNEPSLQGENENDSNLEETQNSEIFNTSDDVYSVDENAVNPNIDMIINELHEKYGEENNQGAIEEESNLEENNSGAIGEENELEENNSVEIEEENDSEEIEYEDDER